MRSVLTSAQLKDRGVCMSVLSRDRNYGCRINDEYTYRGIPVVVLENQLLRISVLAGKGTTIYEFLYKPLDVDFMFLNNQGVRSPDRVPTNAHSWGFLTDFYDGGWHEQLPNAGIPSNYQGTEEGLHGEVCLLPWRWTVLEDSADRVTAKFWVRTYRMPLLLEKTLTLESGSAVLRIDECLTNESSVPVQTMWGHHPTLGTGFLDENCVIDLPPCNGLTFPASSSDNLLRPGTEFDWPLGPGLAGNTIDLSQVPGAEVHQEDGVYLSGLPEGWWAVTNRRLKLGIGLVWPIRVFPHLIYWSLYHGTPSYPWYRQNYNLALEPQSSVPEGLAEAIARNKALQLEPGGRIEMTMRSVVYSGATGVVGISEAGVVTAREER